MGSEDQQLDHILASEALKKADTGEPSLLADVSALCRAVHKDCNKEKKSLVMVWKPNKHLKLTFVHVG